MGTVSKTVVDTSGLADDDSEPYGHDELFFGSIPCFFESVPGETVVYNHSEWTPLTDPDSVALTVSRSRKMGPEKDIVVPAIPACEIGRVLPSPNKKVGSIDDDDSDLLECTLEQWPHYLRKPLLKIPASEKKPYSPKGYASGVRSGMVKLNGKWCREPKPYHCCYNANPNSLSPVGDFRLPNLFLPCRYRLKGSGNNDEGFVVRTSRPNKPGVLLDAHPQFVTFPMQLPRFPCENARSWEFYYVNGRGKGVEGHPRMRL